MVREALSFPDSYEDAWGRELLEAMLNKSPEERLGVGVFGWDDVKERKGLGTGRFCKEHEYFVDDYGSKSLFAPERGGFFVCASRTRSWSAW